MCTAPEVALALERGALAALPSFAIDAFESDSDATARGLRPLISEHVFDKVHPR